MPRFVVALLATTVLSGAVWADLPPPTPPLGKKYVSVNNEVILGKDVTGYVFVLSQGQGPGPPHFFRRKLELPVGKPVAMPDIGRYTYVTLYAVPEGAFKEFKSEAELFEALGLGKVAGAHGLGFSGTTTVPLTTLGGSVKRTHTITAIDASGIKTSEGEGAGAEKPADRPEKKGRPSVLGGACVAGSAGALGLLLGGFWFVGRARRKAQTDG